MPPGGQRIGLRSNGSLLAKTNNSDETRKVIPGDGLNLRLRSGVSNPSNTIIANETNLAIAPGDLRSYAKELASNSHRVVGSQIASTNISKKTNPAISARDLRLGGSKSVFMSERIVGSHPSNNTISIETDNVPSGGSQSFINHILRKSPRKHDSQRASDSVFMSERMDGSHPTNGRIVGSRPANNIISYETDNVPPSGSPSFISHVLRKSPRKPGSQRVLDSVTSSPRVPDDTHLVLRKSPRKLGSQRLLDSVTSSPRVPDDTHLVTHSHRASDSQRVMGSVTDSQIFSESTEVPSKKRNGRKKAQNKSLNDFIDGGGGKPPIEIRIGKRRPLCKWSNEWVTEMGIIVVQNIPLTFHYWKELKDEHKNPLYKKVESKFEIDTSMEHVRDAVDQIFKDRFKDRRHKLHKYYLSIPEGVNKLDFPEKTVTQLEWESLCEHFESEKFKASCERNKKNRAQPRVNHRGGRKPFILHRFEQRDSETGEEPDCVDFYRNMRWNDNKGWIDPQAKENYEKMLRIRSQRSEEDGDEELTDAQIAERVLGKRSGYVMGLGHGEVPPSRKCRAAHNDEDLKQMRLKAEEQEQELVELRAWKASQEELSKTQQLMIEAQAKKQEETNIILNALKEKLGL